MDIYVCIFLLKFRFCSVAVFFPSSQMPAAMFFNLVFKKIMKKKRKKIFVFIPMSALMAVNVAVCFGPREDWGLEA